MIRVRLAAASAWQEVEHRDGMKVKDVLELLKYYPASIGHIRVNDLPGSEEAVLRDGDEMILIPLVDGG